MPLGTGGVENLFGEPRHGLGVTGRAGQFKSADVRVTRGGLPALLGDVLVVAVLRVGQRPLLLPFFLLMIGNGDGEHHFRLRPLATVTRGTAEEPAQPARRRGLETAPVRGGKPLAQCTGIEPGGSREGHEPVEAERRQRQGACQQFVDHGGLPLDLSGLCGGGLLLGLAVVLQAAFSRSLACCGVCPSPSVCGTAGRRFHSGLPLQAIPVPLPACVMTALSPR